MNPVLPHLVVGELRREAHRTAIHANRCRATIALAGVSAWAIAAPQWNMPLTERGHTAFVALSVIGAVICGVAGVRHFAPWPADQGRDGWELLLPTRVRGVDWIASGFVAKWLLAWCETIPILPFLLLTLILGGTSAAECGRMILLLTVTLFVSCGVGLLSAGLWPGERAASAGTVLGLFALWVWTPLAGAICAPLLPWDHVCHWCCAISPGFAFATALEPRFQQAPAAFQESLLLQGALGAALLLVACRKLVRSQRSPESFDRGQAIEAHPATAYLWIPILALAASIPALVLSMGRGNRATIGYSLGALYSGHLCFKILMAIEASHRLHAERRAGTLGLERATGRAPEEILARHFCGLRKRFFGPLVGLALGNAAALISILLLSNPLQLEEKMSLAAALMVGAAELFTDGYGLTWKGMQLGFRGRRASGACGRTVAWIVLSSWLLVWLLFTVYQGGLVTENEIVAGFLCRATLGLGGSVVIGLLAKHRLEGVLRVAELV